MADYISLRLAAARVGVSMAFFALLGGLADKARATPRNDGAPAAVSVLSARWPTTAATTASVHKLNSALVTAEHKLAKNFYSRSQINKSFLKIRSANTEFLKIKSADTTFLKLDDANSQFLKLDDANVHFLKIDAANAQFLKASGTAANSNELGGQTADAFFQGNGHVVTGAASPALSETKQLLSLPGGIIVVSVDNDPAAGLQLTIHNGSGVNLPAVQDMAGGAPTSVTLPANQDYSVGLEGGASQLHMQIFPAGSAFPDVVTLMVSDEAPQSGVPQFVGQAFTGGV